MIEVQIHPSDIRGRVRYLFFSGSRVVLLIVIGALLLSTTLLAMAVAPSVFRRAHHYNELRNLQRLKQVEMTRLQENADQMAALEQLVDSQRFGIEKLVTVYGLDESPLGQGGELKPLDLSELPEEERLTLAREREEALRRSVEKLEDQVQMIADHEAANNDLVRHVPAILPLPELQFVLTSPFGTRISPFTRTEDFHRGIDLAAPEGTPIRVTADGVVTFAGRYPLSRSVAWWRFGNVVVVSHADRFITIYAHCDEVKVKTGDHVTQGDVIATVGSTGWSTSSHLHYEIRTDINQDNRYEPVDPRIYILDHRWNNEEKLLIRSRSVKEYQDYEPLPSAFIRGRRRGV